MPHGNMVIQVTVLGARFCGIGGGEAAGATAAMGRPGLGPTAKNAPRTAGARCRGHHPGSRASNCEPRYGR
jgi:hypothetical protein